MHGPQALTRASIHGVTAIVSTLTWPIWRHCVPAAPHTAEKTVPPPVEPPETTIRQRAPSPREPVEASAEREITVPAEPLDTQAIDRWTLLTPVSVKAVAVTPPVADKSPDPWVGDEEESDEEENDEEENDEEERDEDVVDPLSLASDEKPYGEIAAPSSARSICLQLGREPSSLVRAEYLNTLRELDDKDTIPAIEASLADEEAVVRLAAVRALYRVQGRDCGQALVRMFADPDMDVRRRAVSCIGWLGHASLAPDLLPFLDDDSAFVRIATIQAIRRLGARQLVPAVIERIDDGEDDVWQAALRTVEDLTQTKLGDGPPLDRQERQRLTEKWRTWNATA